MCMYIKIATKHRKQLFGHSHRKKPTQSEVVRSTASNGQTRRLCWALSGSHRPGDTLRSRRSDSAPDRPRRTACRLVCCSSSSTDLGVRAQHGMHERAISCRVTTRVTCSNSTRHVQQQIYNLAQSTKVQILDVSVCWHHCIHHVHIIYQYVHCLIAIAYTNTIIVIAVSKKQKNVYV